MIIKKTDRPTFKIKQVTSGAWALFAYLQNGQKIVPVTNPAQCGTQAYCQTVKNTVLRDFSQHGQVSF